MHSLSCGCREDFVVQLRKMIGNSGRGGGGHIKKSCIFKTMLLLIDHFANQKFC